MRLPCRQLMGLDETQYRLKLLDTANWSLLQILDLQVQWDRKYVSNGKHVSLPTSYMHLRDHWLDRMVYDVCAEVFQFQYPFWSSTIVDLNDGKVTNVIPRSSILGFDEASQNIWTQIADDKEGTDLSKRQWLLEQWPVQSSGRPSKLLPFIMTVLVVIAVLADIQRFRRLRSSR